MSVDASTNDDLQTRLREALAVIAQRDAQIAEMAAVGAYRAARIKVLEAQMAAMNRALYGRRSEQLDPAQRQLFEEALEEDIVAIQTELETLKESPSTPRRQPKRLPLPEHLPREEVRHEPASCTCTQCGNALTPMGEDVTEQLDCKPAEFFVRRHIYPKYACRACETVTAAPSQASVIERGRRRRACSPTC